MSSAAIVDDPPNEQGHMTVNERAVLFRCEGEELVGVLTGANDSHEVGVLILVGGPQYRVGSHRQFVLLARRLADAGYPTLRFDCRGMGDATGAMRTFEDFGPDVAAGIQVLLDSFPRLRKVVVWGLCDAASAALMFAAADRRVVGFVLLNPWFRNEETMAEVYLRSYYTSRALSPAFWRTVLRGAFSPSTALHSLTTHLLQAASGRLRRSAPSAGSFRDSMLRGLETFRGPVLLLLSGRDLTAQEFMVGTSHSNRWRSVLARDGVLVRKLPDADHTFSSAALRESVEQFTIHWLRESVMSARGRADRAEPQTQT